MKGIHAILSFLTAVLLVPFEEHSLIVSAWTTSQQTTLSIQHRASSHVSRTPNRPRLQSMEKESEPSVTSATRTRQANATSDFGAVPMIARCLAGLVLVFQILTSAPSNAIELSYGRRYYDIMRNGEPQERVQANTALMDFAVGTVNTMYYDHSGGAYFSPKDFFQNWRTWVKNSKNEQSLSTRQGAIEGLRWLVAQLNDPFSKYLTRDEWRQEFTVRNEGFLGLGAMVEPPEDRYFFGSAPVTANVPIDMKKKDNLLGAKQIENLPVVTALAPDSPAERAGLTVGDRIVAVAEDSFMGKTAQQVKQRLSQRYAAENYLGHPDLTVAKPVYATSNEREAIVAYRPTRVRLATTAVQPFQINNADNVVSGGDTIVHYELLTSQGSIFDRSAQKVGYIRLTRFSKASTDGYVKAVEALEKAGATSYIIDVRNNYGGVIQEAMLTASTLLRDPHAVLCYTMNSRGGFTPHDVEEYVVDHRYPGYLLSREPRTATSNQVKRENPEYYEEDGIMWVPPSSYASLREQQLKRNIHRTSMMALNANSMDRVSLVQRQQLAAQKDVVILINEGTASSAEVFASALHDNGRTVALIGTKTYGKGLIQHTFPMPDGGGLRLTVAEYLTPALHHVTNVGGAQFDRESGEWVGGGIRPDIVCASNGGIPGKIGSDLCVGMALDALEEAEMSASESTLPGQVAKRVGGSHDGSQPRRPVIAGIVRDDF